MKYCGGCKQTKDESEFNKNRNRKDGLSTQCRECSKEYYQNNREAIRKKQREQRQRNREARKEYLEKKRDEIRNKAKEWRENNREEILEWKRNYERNRRNSDVQYAITLNLRTRLNKAIRLGSKRGSAVRDLGCSIEELLEHLESQFYDERMSWDTWGPEWHIDHIYPLAAADIEDRVQFLAVNNWRNLQPLTVEENLSKGNTVTPEAQLLFDELCDMFRKKEEAA